MHLECMLGGCVGGWSSTHLGQFRGSKDVKP